MDTSTEENIIINDVVVEKGLAVYDETTKDLLKPFSDSENYSSDESNWDDYQNHSYHNDRVVENNQNENDFDFSNFDVDIGPNFMDQFLNNDFKQDEIPQSSTVVKKPKVTSTLKKEMNETVKRTNVTTPGLNYTAKVPNVVWQESDEIIVLTISATDNMPYNLEVTDSELIYW